MAETTKKKPGRPKKVVEEPKVEPVVTNEDIIAQLMQQIKEQNEKMAELQAQIENNKTQQVVVTQAPQNEYTSKKIKLINLMHNMLVLSTEPSGKGRLYTFEKYGDVKYAKFDDLMDIVSAHPSIMEKGLCYIADKEVVKMLGLEDEYENLVTPELMNEMPALRDECYVDMFIGMDSKLQESMAMEMAKRINDNKRMDYNYLQRIKDETGIDVQEIAKELKDLERKPNDEI